MNQLHDRAKVYGARTTIADKFGAEQKKRRPQALANREILS